MANQNGTVFSRLLNTLRGGRTGVGDDQQKKILSNQPINPYGSIEQKQQEFLDVQSSKIAYDLYTRSIYYDTDRLAAYNDFKAMDLSPEISAALDILVDETCTKSEKGEILEIYSNNSRIKGVLKNLFHNNLNINYNLMFWTREMLKFGDCFVKLETDRQQGVFDCTALPVQEIHREEAYDGNLNSARFRWDLNNMYFEEWQVAHFRIATDGARLPYGRSILEPARKLWKQLQLAEDAMLVYRLVRAPERRVYYIEVGNTDPKDIPQYIEKMKAAVKKSSVVDPTTGQVNLKYNPLTYEEDFYLPVRNGVSSKIETLQGACIALDTKIPLLDGRILKLSEIIREWNEGNKNMWVYSCHPKTGEVVPGIITWAGETRKNTDVLKITLDNGEEIISTPDHKFVHRTNGFVEAKDLIVGDSLMPFYESEDYILKKKYSKKYHQIWDNKQQKWIFTHRVVTDSLDKFGLIKEFTFDEKYSKKQKNTRHHKDFNRYNNLPNNLVWMNNDDHFKYHQSVIMETIWNKPEENKEKISKGLKKYMNSLSEKDFNERMLRINNPEVKAKTTKKLLDWNKNEENKKSKFEKVKKTKNLPENKKKYSENTKKLWLNEEHKNKVFSKPQKIVFTDSLYEMFYNEYLLHGKADLTLEVLNRRNDFMEEYRNSNTEIRSSLFNPEEFNHNNLTKMLKERGYKSYRDWMKKTSDSLGYKNVRAMRYYIDKNKKQTEQSFYNHKIIKIEWLETKMDTGTITVDGEEKYHNYHTFAIESGIFIKNSNLSDIMDINYLQDKLFAAIKVPKAYLNYSEKMEGGSTLAQSDLRFARTVNRIQEMMLIELRRIANIHLFLLGFQDDMDNFDLKLSNPSTQQELLKLEVTKARLEVFKEMFSAEATSPTSYTWAMQNILGFSEAEIKLILRQKKVEKKMFAEIEEAAENYGKTGLFKDVDEKFSKLGEGEGMADAEGGEGSAEGGEGGTDAETPEAPVGGGEDVSGLPTEETPEGGETLSENVLLSENIKLFSKTKSLLENLDRKFKDLDK